MSPEERAVLYTRIAAMSPEDARRAGKRENVGVTLAVCGRMMPGKLCGAESFHGWSIGSNHEFGRLHRDSEAAACQRSAFGTRIAAGLARPWVAAHVG